MEYKEQISITVLVALELEGWRRNGSSFN